MIAASILSRSSLHAGQAAPKRRAKPWPAGWPGLCHARRRLCHGVEAGPRHSSSYADRAFRTHGGTVHANQSGDGLSHRPPGSKPPHPEVAPKR
eukprot:807036-Pleurochrysis_carterae.AAC.1